jgi:hypothetical protein
MTDGHRPYLVIVRAGDRSLHESWLQCSQPRNWDLVVSYYADDPNIWRRDGVRRIDDKGPKWPPLHRLLGSDALDWSGYEYVWLPDDDLATDGDQVSAMFDMASALGVSIAQPSLSWRSYFSHEITLNNPAFSARYTNFVEVMAPVFSRSFLHRVIDTLGMSESGWGLDHVWPYLVTDPLRDCAIIDAVQVTHTRPVGGPNYAALSGRKSPHEEMHAVLARFGLRDMGQFSLGGITADARMLSLFDESSDAFLAALVSGYAQGVSDQGALDEVLLRHHRLREQLRPVQTRDAVPRAGAAMPASMLSSIESTCVATTT